MNSPRSRRGGFSLLEILVVLGIAASIASLALGGFSSFQGSQRRSTCQSNMVQIYRACRLYSSDNDFFPPLNQTNKAGGLALLWGRIDGPTNAPIVRPPLDSSLSYLKSSSALHCPADVNYTTTSSPNAIIEDPTLGVIVDPKYLSYQKLDEDAAQLTYNDVRLKINKGSVVTSDYSRQLRHLITVPVNPANPTGPTKDVEANIPIPSSTVITWCQFHRGLSAKPDNVLFYDGSVRRMEITQSAGCLPGRPAAKGALRLSECSTANNNEGAALAQP